MFRAYCKDVSDEGDKDLPLTTLLLQCRSTFLQTHDNQSE